MPDTYVYVDGFNLYKGVEEHIVRRTRRGLPAPAHWKWIDLAELGRRLAPTDRIRQIRYFTARVTAPSNDPGLSQRQETYLRALATLPNVTPHFGQFKVRAKRMPLSRPPGRVRELGLKMLGFSPKRYPDGNVSVYVRKTEEKGSDVNLATLLLLDAFDQAFSKAIVISNDTDLCLPIKYVTQRFKLSVVVVNPRGYQKVARDLAKVATERRKLRLGAVEQAQLPETLSDSQGTITRPTGW